MLKLVICGIFCSILYFKQQHMSLNWQWLVLVVLKKIRYFLMIILMYLNCSLFFKSFKWLELFSLLFLDEVEHKCSVWNYVFQCTNRWKGTCFRFQGQIWRVGESLRLKSRGKIKLLCAMLPCGVMWFLFITCIFGME